uniref:Uncharacterized protein n=1 Tax=Magallana gigas TaxID=29159 RepID=A0A8W8LMT1_MAGGI
MKNRVIRKNHVNDHIVQPTILLDHLIRNLSGQIEECKQKRHKVRIVPVTQCLYKWKNTESDFNLRIRIRTALLCS